MKKNLLILLLLLVPCNSWPVDLQKFEEKIEARNEELKSLKEELLKQQQKAIELYEQKADPLSYHKALGEVKDLRKKIEEKENTLREETQKDLDFKEPYALWEQGELLLSRLVLEYGSYDYLYVIPSDMAGIKLQLASSLPIPRACWPEMIEIILSTNGIGVKNVNAYAKVLYWLKQIPSQVEVIANDEKDLETLSEQTRVFFLLSPPLEEIKIVQGFLERFSDPKKTFIQPVRSKLAIVTFKEDLQRLLSLYRATWKEGSEKKQVRVVSSPKMGLPEAERILKAFFPSPDIKTRPFFQTASEELSIFTLPQGVVLVGSNSSIERAEKVIKDIESQLEDPLEMTLFWYTCKHANPEEVAHLLEKVYLSLSQANLEKTNRDEPTKNLVSSSSTLPVSPPIAKPGSPVITSKKGKEENFIVDDKTGSILMVVRKDLLPKIQQLVEKIDIPKKMVQIDVLLVEKKHHNRRQIGASMLDMGSNKTNKEATIRFDTRKSGINKGILEFLFSRPSSNGPGIDMAYHFLMGQEEVQINANPSILTVNQTPAFISIVEEISINNGAIPIDTSKGTSFEKSFTRAQYGTTLTIIPTIHLAGEGKEQNGLVTLNTDITFDTTQMSEDARPPVTRRHVKNEIQVADGETIILGGLRRKSNTISQEKIPFLGEIPGVGKLFGFQKESDIHTEMFIFITPHIVKDSRQDRESLRKKELEKRPGDIPEFLAKMEEAKQKKKKRLFADSLDFILGE